VHRVSAEGDRPIRFRCDLPAVLQWDGVQHPVRVLDLSETGAFVETNLDLQVGDEAELSLDSEEADFKAKVTVTRLASAQRELRDPRAHTLTVTRPGAAITFSGLSTRRRDSLNRLLARIDES
jgi:hypothetical protein